MCFAFGTEFQYLGIYVVGKQKFRIQDIVQQLQYKPREEIQLVSRVSK